MTKYFIFLALLIFIGCGETEKSQQSKLESENDEKSALERTNPAGTYGKEITLTKQTKISEILETPEKYDGKQVLISGTVVEVCPKRGCWINLAGDKEFQQIQVKVKDGEIVFPLSAKGSQALVEGIVQKLELTKKQAINWKAHQAEERGEEFDSTTVTGPMTIWRIKGLGAEIKG